MSGPTASDSIYLWLDENSLKIAKARKFGGRLMVVEVYYKDVTSLSPDDTAGQIALGVHALLPKAKIVYLVLPSKYVITKNIEVPSLDDEEIQSIVRLQAVRHTPYSKEEVTVSYLNLEVLLERYTKTLLVIGSNENIRKKTKAVQMAGFDVEAVYLSSEALAKTAGLYFSASRQETPYGYVYLDMDSTDFMAIHRQRPYFMRSIPIGLRQINQDPAGQIPKLVEELKKSKDAYSEEDQANAFKGFAIAGLLGDKRDRLVKALEEQLKISAEAIDQERFLNLSPEAHARMSQQAQVTFMDVASAAAAGETLSVDLLPDDLKLKRSFRNKAREMVVTGMFMVAIFGLMVGIFVTQIFFRNQGLREMQQTYAAKQQEADELIALSEESKLVREFKQKRGVAIKAMDEFQKSLPAQMIVNELTLNDEGRMTAKGTSELMSLVFSYVTEMENHPYFKGVTSDYTKSRKEGDKDVTDFGISWSLESASSA